MKVNQQNLRNVTSSFLDQLSNSVELLPHQVQTVCRSLHKVGGVVAALPSRTPTALLASPPLPSPPLPQVLQAHYPQRAAEMLSSTVFLRFINPALVAPQHFGLVNPGEIPPAAARGLTLMSKVMVSCCTSPLPSPLPLPILIPLPSPIPFPPLSYRSSRILPTICPSGRKVT